MKRLITLVLLLLFHHLLFPQSKKQITSQLKPFIPAGFTILDKATGDLNKDGYPDMILVLKNKLDVDSNRADEVARPLLILLGKKGGGFSLYARNDSVVLCRNCGGVFGDPYEGITIKGHYFSLEHYGGSRYRWSRSITFKYDAASREFILHRDAGVSYDDTKPGKQTVDIYNKAGFDKWKFVDYRDSDH